MATLHTELAQARQLYMAYLQGSSSDITTRTAASGRINPNLITAAQKGDFNAITELCHCYLMRLYKTDCPLTRAQLFSTLGNACSIYGTAGHLLAVRYYTELIDLASANAPQKKILANHRYQHLILAEQLEDSSAALTSIAYDGQSIKDIEPEFSSWENAKTYFAPREQNIMSCSAMVK